MKKSELRQIIREEISDTYASSFGGHDQIDQKKVKEELNRLGYDTPYKGLWNQIIIEKDGVKVGKIDISGNMYYVYPKGEYNNTPYKWEGIEQLLNHLK